MNTIRCSVSVYAYMLHAFPVEPECHGRGEVRNESLDGTSPSSVGFLTRENSGSCDVLVNQRGRLVQLSATCS